MKVNVRFDSRKLKWIAVNQNYMNLSAQDILGAQYDA